MKLLFDLLPIATFFVVYKLFNIYAATATAIGISLVQILYDWLKHRRIDYLLLVSTGLIVLLGSMTLWLHDELFIKWKPTAISWAFSCAFLISPFVGPKKPLIQLMFETLIDRTQEQKMTLPTNVWRRLNILWMLFYLFTGIANIYVIYQFDTNTWVNFKLFGILGLNLIFVVLQSFYITNHLK